MSNLALQQTIVPFLWLIIPLAILDITLKAWSLWRAARMSKQIWFIALIVVNSLGILPVIFLLLTKDEYLQYSAKHVE